MNARTIHTWSRCKKSAGLFFLVLIPLRMITLRRSHLVDGLQPIVDELPFAVESTRLPKKADLER